MKIVQVTSDAKARPIMTALTTTSADLNIVHGDNSLSSAAAAFRNFSRSGCAAGVSAGAAGSCETAGACCTAGGAAGAVPCWADVGAASDSIASAVITAN